MEISHILLAITSQYNPVTELPHYKITTTTLNYITSSKFHTNMGN